MEDKIIIKLIENTLKDKIKSNPNYIRYSFYALRVKYNLSEEDTDRFLFLIRAKDYKVYFTETNFDYINTNITVQNN